MPKDHPVRAWRQKAQLSQRQVCALVRSELPESKFSEPYLSQIETGERRPGWELAKVLAALSGAEVSVLMDWTAEADVAARVA